MIDVIYFDIMLLHCMILDNKYADITSRQAGSCVRRVHEAFVTQLHTDICHSTKLAHRTPASSLSDNDVNNRHDNQEEVKLVPAVAPVVVPAQPRDFDGSFNDEDSGEGVVAVLFGLGKGWRLTISSGCQGYDVSHDGCCNDVVEGLQGTCC